MIFKAILSSKAKPGYGQATIPFPIPDSEYDYTIGLLEAMDIGSPTAQDCRVDEVDSTYPILNRLVTQTVNVDELDYLAKRLDSFCQGEIEKFQAMSSKLCLSDIKDFINLTFCCQQATVITDFSNLEQVGKGHALTVNGGSMPMEEFDKVDGQAVALDLIQSGAGVVTPYGAVYDNGMELEQVYDGQHFPAYDYKLPQLTVEIKSGPEGKVTGYLYLPSSDRQIQRTLMRAGSGSEGFRMEIAMDELPPQVSNMVSPTRDGLDDLNALCRAIEPLSTEQRKKLDAVVLLAQPKYADEVRQLAENLDQFDFVPKSDRPEADSALTELGYVAYHGSMSLEALMGPPHEPSQRRVVWGEEPQRNERALPCGQGERYGACGDEMLEDPAERHQREQEMGGMA